MNLFNTLKIVKKNQLIILSVKLKKFKDFYTLSSD